MPINFRYDPDVGILLTHAEGLLTFDEILRHLNEQRNAKDIAHPEILDATKALTDSTAEQIRIRDKAILVAEYWKEITT